MLQVRRHQQSSPALLAHIQTAPISLLLSSAQAVQRGVIALEENLTPEDCVPQAIIALLEHDLHRSFRVPTKRITFTMGSRRKANAKNALWDIFANLEQFDRFLAL